MRFLLILPLVAGLAACQFALPQSGKAPNAEGGGNPITGSEIEVTSLDAPEASADATDPKPAAAAAADPEATPDPLDTQSALSPEAAADPAPEAEPEPPPIVKSPAQLACEKKKGVWRTAGSANASFCQTPTRDGGKSCRKETDCQGNCLAKSGTCAPAMPLFGCNDILTADGKLITQCIN